MYVMLIGLYALKKETCRDSARFYFLKLVPVLICLCSSLTELVVVRSW